MEKGVLILFLISLIAVFLSSFTSAATRTCYNCSNCTAEIAAASIGDTVKLNNSLPNNNRSCIDFADKNSIIFTCQNYSNYIEGNGSLSNFYYGINLSVTSNNTVDSCNISKFREGIHTDAYAFNITLRNLILDKNLRYEIYLGAFNSTLTNLTITNSSNQYGIYIASGSQYNNLTNIILTYHQYGIYSTADSNYNLFQNITSSFNSYGIYLTGSNGNNINNCTIFNNTKGLYLFTYSNNNTISNIKAYSNTIGIESSSSNNNTIINSNLSENSQLDFYLGPFDNNENKCQNYLINVTSSGNRTIGFYNYPVNLSNQIFSLLYLCNASRSNLTNITIRGSETLSNNGFLMINTNSSNISGINSSENFIGVYLANSNNNTLRNLTIKNINNGVWFNGYSDYNTLRDSFIQLNTYGLYFQTVTNSPNYNYIYNNYFNNSGQFYNDSSMVNFFNTTKTLGINVVGGSYIGGNYWAAPNGSGFSQTCTSSTDGICDTAFSLDGVNYDYLPLTCLESWSCGSWQACRPGGTQIRTCTDANLCQTYKYKPIESQSCSYTGGGNETQQQSPIVQSSWGVISPSSPAVVEVNNSKSGIVNISITTTINVSSASLTMEQLSNLTFSNFKIGTKGVVYQAFEINVVNLNASNLATVIIGFRVNRTWIQQNTSNPNRIYLYRQPSGSTKWNRLLTTQTGADSDYYYYSAISPGFSTFLVYYDAGDCVPTSMQCINKEIQYCADNSTWVVKKECLFGCSDGSCRGEDIFPYAYYIAGIAIFLGIVIFVYLKIRKRGS